MPRLLQLMGRGDTKIWCSTELKLPKLKEVLTLSSIKEITKTDALLRG
jgi:hypothetical protein